MKEYRHYMFGSSSTYVTIKKIVDEMNRAETTGKTIPRSLATIKAYNENVYRNFRKYEFPFVPVVDEDVVALMSLNKMFDAETASSIITRYRRHRLYRDAGAHVVGTPT